MKNKYRIVIRNIKIALRKAEYDYDSAALVKAKTIFAKSFLAKIISAENFNIFKKSVDARDRNQIFFIYSVIFEVCVDEKNYEKVLHFCSKDGFGFMRDDNIEFTHGTEKFTSRPIVAGFGPAGMFCAYFLAMYGFRPIVLERGSDVDKRVCDVENYWKNSLLDEESNVQFGEGGAGTFSDGKLLTRINDPLCSNVLETFVKFGADRKILNIAKPHIGTDKLRVIVKNMREKIKELGGQVFFNTKLTSVFYDSFGNISKISTSAGDFECKALFLALGHSARDSFSMLMKNDMDVAPKPFSVGVRIEHLQENIDKAMYGNFYDSPALSHAEYTLSYRTPQRAVYSFCMCPGGTVVASASQNGTIVTNGMSYSQRNGRNANSAIAVSVSEHDFGNSAEKAIEFQHNIEKKAFLLAGNDNSAPISTLGYFLGRNSQNEPCSVLPTYTGKTELCDIKPIFPDFVNDMLKIGFQKFESNIKGFSCDDAILTAPETRTSSPVRILRNADYNSKRHSGIYPCGEGAGYAGGITSAAVDGIKAAVSFMKKYYI